MEPVTIITAALGFIFKAVTGTKLVKDVENTALTKFWNWIKPKVTESVPQIEEKPEEADTLTQTKAALLELVKNEDFFNELVGHIDALKKAGVKEKNIVNADLEDIRVVRIGDKTYSARDEYTSKNVFKGSAKNIGEFNVGDGW